MVAQHILGMVTSMTPPPSSIDRQRSQPHLPLRVRCLQQVRHPPLLRSKRVAAGEPYRTSTQAVDDVADGEGAAQADGRWGALPTGTSSSPASRPGAGSAVRAAENALTHVTAEPSLCLVDAEVSGPHGHDEPVDHDRGHHA